jgi:ATP adenylyltransferase
MGQLEPSVLEEIALLAQSSERVLEQIYHPGGLNVGMNLGEAAGAGIEQHIHLHVLPRWVGDANFMTTVGGTRVLPEALDHTYEKVREGFEKSAAR